MDSQFDYLLKYIILGDSSVGKTSLVNRFMGYDYEELLQTGAFGYFT